MAFLLDHSCGSEAARLAASSGVPAQHAAWISGLHVAPPATLARYAAMKGAVLVTKDPAMLALRRELAERAPRILLIPLHMDDKGIAQMLRQEHKQLIKHLARDASRQLSVVSGGGTAMVPPAAQQAVRARAAPQLNLV